MQMKDNYPNISILDCTLRDGGHVNDFNFGRNQMIKIIHGLSFSRVNIIELGFLKDGSCDRNRSLYTLVSEAEELIKNEKKEQSYSLMIRPDWYDISQLQKCEGQIKILRFAFHYRDFDLTMFQAKRAKELGYSIFLNPVNVLSYGEKELVALLSQLNEFVPDFVGIIDTHGSMMKGNILRIYELFESNLNKDIGIGLHLHENLSISFALAQEFIHSKNSERAVCIDSSILGMGRIPGNLCTELMMNYLNLTDGANYSLESIYDLADNVIGEIKKKIPWGYSPEYAITAFKRMHRTYAEFLRGKTNLSLKDIEIILEKITDKNDCENFNQQLAEELYQSHVRQ